MVKPTFLGTFSCPVAFLVAVHSYSPFSMVLSQFSFIFCEGTFYFFTPALIVGAPVLQILQFLWMFHGLLYYLHDGADGYEWNSFC